MLSTGDYAAGLQNGGEMPNSLNSDIQAGGFPFSGMDWVGASSSLANYPAYSMQPHNNNNTQAQAGPSNRPSFGNSADTLYGA